MVPGGSLQWNFNVRWLFWRPKCTWNGYSKKLVMGLNKTPKNCTFLSSLKHPVERGSCTCACVGATWWGTDRKCHWMDGNPAMIDLRLTPRLSHLIHASRAVRSASKIQLINVWYVNVCGTEKSFEFFLVWFVNFVTFVENILKYWKFSTCVFFKINNKNYYEISVWNTYLCHNFAIVMEERFVKFIKFVM